MRNYLITLAMAIALLIASCQVATAQQTTLLNENFNSISSGVPTNWDNSDYDCSSSYVWQSDASGYSGTRGMKFNTYSASSGTYSTLKTPTLNLNQAYYLKFKYQNYNAGQLDVRISLDGGTTYTTVIASNLTTATSSEWAEVEYSLSAYQGNNNVKIVFYGVSNWGSYRQYIDDVVIESAPTCKNPSGIYVSNLTTTTATLNWALSQDGDVPAYYDLVVTDPNGTDVVNSTTVPGTSLSYALTGLSANTTYTVSMRGNCNATLGGYSKYETYSFTTACNTSSIPYTENFDNLTGVPDCTTSLNCSINSSYKYGTSGKSLQFSTTASNSAYMVFPLLNHAANDLEVSFMIRGYNTSTPVAFQVGVVGDAADIEGTFEPLYIDSALGTTWTEVRMNTTQSSYSTSPSEICIFVGSGTSASIYVDDVSIHTIPTCIRPEQFRAYNPTATSVDLAWTTSTATQHIIYITDANSNVTRQVVTTNPYTVTGLQPNSGYSFNLRALCTATDSSEMASATATATTLCMPQASAIWSEGAENTTGTAIPNCWTYGYFNRPSGTTYDQPIITQTSYKHSGSRGFQLQDMTSGTTSYLTSQGFTVDSANKYQASIWVYRTSGTSYSGEGLHLYVSTQPDNVTGAEDLGFINRCAGNSPVETAGTGWYNYTYPIATTGTVYLIIEGDSKWGSSTYFDDISVELAPTCLVPGDVTIGTATMSDVAISWTAGASNETSWVLAYELMSGSTVVSSDSLTVTTPSYTVTGLAAASSYTLNARVYAVCSPTDMSAAKSASSSFTTPCATITTLPYSQDFEAMTTGTTPTCWDISASTSSSATSNASYIWGVYNYSSNNSLRMYNYLARSGTALINTPTITLPAQAAELMFKYSNRANCGDLYVKISTDNGTTFVDLGNYSSSGSTSSTAPGTFTQETIDLYSYAGQSVIIQFFANANYGNGAMFIDDVVVRLAPTCRDIVGGATVYDIKPNSARVSISDTSVTDWDICYGPTGTAAGAGTIINVSGRMDTIITGLTNGTTYVVYVRRNCGATDLGAWTITPVTFTCSCTPATATISQVNARDAVVTATAADWELCYGPSGTTTSTGTIVPVTGSATYNLTGLTPSTNYVAYVRHNCGNSEYSDWSSAYNFQTTSIPDSLPFGTGFENSADDGGWHIVNGTYTTNVFTIGTDANAVCSGSRALYMSNNSSYGYSNSSATKTYAYRTIYFPEGTTHLSFNWKCTGGESTWDFGRVMLVPASETLTGGTGSSYSGTTFPNFIRAFDPAGANKMNLTTGDANGWNLYETDITLSTDSAGTYNFVVMWNNDGSAGNNYPIAIDNISISQVTCNVPTVLASALTANGGTVTATSQETQNIEVVVSSTPIDIYSTVTGDLYQGVTSAPVVLTSMQPNTPFYYTARAICGPGDTSRWAAVQTARSSCAAMSVPYTEGFEDSGALSCWTSVGDVAPSRNTQYHYAGSASLKINNGTAISPEMNVASLSTYMLTGQAYTTSDSAVFTVGVMVDPSDGSTYTDLGTVTIYRNGSDWTEFTTYFTLLTDPDYIDFANAKHFAIAAGSDVTIYVDDLYLGVTPTCPKPTEISVTNVMSNSCQVAWTNNAAGCTQWIVKATPTTAGQQTITQVVTTNPVTITGLNPASSYSISMAAICSATDTSLWAQGATIRTACSTVNAPYTEDFETHTANQTPDCWDISGSTTSTATSTPYYVWGVYSYGGNQMIRMDNWDVQSGTAEIISPIIALAAGNNYELRFDYCHQSNGGDMSVGISTDGGTNWTTVGTYSATSTGSYTAPGAFTTVAYSLSSYAGSNIMLRFSATANWGSGAIFVDNVKVRQLRNCLDVASLSGNIGANDATITITDTVATHTQWQYMYGATGFDTTGVTPTLISTDTFSITGLTASTNYTVYVRAYCDATEQSNWIPYNFKTTSQPAAFPYVCHFTDATENAAWDMNSSGNNAFVIGNDAGACGAGETAGLYVANSGSYGYNNGSSSAANAYRLFRFNASQYTLHFSWKCTGGESYYDYARFYFVPANSTPSLPSTGYYDASDWPTNIIALDGGTKVNLISSPEWNDVDMTLDMSNRPGSYYLVFNWSNDGSAGNNYPLAINDIEISELTCTSPVVTIPAATITTNSAVINYTVADTNATVRYWYNTTGSRVDTTNITTATGSPITLTGLSASSNYYFYMQTICSATDQSPIAATTFKTACGVINSYPFTEGFEGSEFEPNCWTNTGNGSLSWSQYTGSTSSYKRGSYSATVSGYSTGTGNLLATPQFEFDSLREYKVSFYMYRSTYSYYTDKINVYLSRNPSSTVGATLLGGQTVNGASTSGMQQISYDLPMYTDGNWYIIFEGQRNYSYDSNYVYLDDINVDVYPTCRDLSAAPTVVSTTATTMTVTAQKGPNHQGIIFAYAPSTATSVADTVGSVYSTTGTAVIQGLTASTTYKVYARGVCSATDSTAWTDAATGTTMASDCFDPQNLRVVGLVGATSATFTWGGAPEATGYEYQCGTGITGTVTIDTLVLTNLTPSTAYTLQVRGVCSGGYTNWVTLSFTTTAQPGALPYVCDFETASENNQWEYIQNTTNSNYFIIGNDISNGGSNSLYITNDGSSNAYSTSTAAVSFARRFFQLPAGQYAYSFDWKGYGESSWDYSRAFLVPDNVTHTAGSLPSGVGTTGTPSGWISLDGNAKFNLSNTWQTKSGTFNVTTAGNYYLMFLWRDDTSGGSNPPTAIDNVQIQQLTCPSPTVSVVTTSITQTSADIYVYNTNTSDTLIYAVSTGSLTDAFLTDTIIGDTIHLNNLAGSSNYTVYVKVHCGAGDESFYENVSFRTLCGQAALPYYETFSTVATSYSGPGMIEDICWNDLNASTSSSSYPNYYGSTSYTNTGHSLLLNSSNTTTLYLIMPSFGDIGNCQISFDLRYESTTASGEVSVGYITNPSSASTFTSLQTVPRNNTTLNSYSYSLTGIPAGARLAFSYGNAGSSYYWAYLSNVDVRQLVQGPQYTDTICYNSPYTNHGFNVSASDMIVGVNNLTRQISGAAGAPDTVVTATVTMRPQNLTVQYDTICQGDTLHWMGYHIPNATARAYTLPSGTLDQYGCDSIVTLYLSIYPTFSEIYDTICEGNVYTFRGVNYTQTNDYTIIGQNPRGCVDTVILHLYAVPTHTRTVASACPGESYQWHGVDYTQSGTYYWTGIGARGCTSRDTLVLTVGGGTNRTQALCQGGTIVFGSQSITAAGTYYNTYYDAQIGCTLTDTLTVTITPAKEADVYGDACEGIPYYQYGINGQIFTGDTVVTTTTKDANLCDSIMHVHITYHPTVYSDTDAYIKAGETFTWYNNTYNTAGKYTENLQTIHGCDSIVTLNLHVSGSGVDNVSDINIDIVPNPVNAGATAFVYGNFGEAKSVEILNNFGQVIDQFEPKSYPIEVSGITAAGLYYVRITTVDGEVHLQKLVVK